MASSTLVLPGKDDIKNRLKVFFPDESAEKFYETIARRAGHKQLSPYELALIFSEALNGAGKLQQPLRELTPKFVHALARGQAHDLARATIELILIQ